MEELPSGWTRALLGDVAEVLDHRRVPLNQVERAARPGPYPYYGANGQVGTVDGFLFEGDHILLAEDGGYFDDPHRPNAYEVSGRFWVNNHAHILKCFPHIESRYLLHVLNATDLMPYVSGTTRLKLTQGDMRCIPIPLPPLAEQRRIVARIEALFARTRRARAELGRSVELVRRFRGACVEKAYEPDSDAGWHTVPAAALAEIKSGITLGKRYSSETRLVERPYLRVANVQRGHLNLDEVKTILVSEAEANRLALHDGDVLMNEGGDRDKLGRGWVWQGEVFGCIHQNHVFRLRLKTDAVTPVFLSRYANHFGQRYFLDEGKQTTNLASVSMSKVAALPVPVPPPGEAAKIDAQLDSAEKKADILAGEATRALALLDRLDAAILARAFRGELVPQDPADEPARLPHPPAAIARPRRRAAAPA